MNNLVVKFENGIRKLIEGIVESEYKKRGYNNVKPDVTVEFQKSISVSVNTEVPFLGEEFWEFISEVGTKMENAIKVFGFVYKKTKYIYDFCIIYYEFKVE